MAQLGHPTNNGAIRERRIDLYQQVAAILAGEQGMVLPSVSRMLRGAGPPWNHHHRSIKRRAPATQLLPSGAGSRPGRLATASRPAPLTLASQVGILFCPWCGWELRRFYRHVLAEMAERDRGLGLPIS